MNTFGYVGGNPVISFDSKGLTQEQIDTVLEFVRNHNKDLNVPKKCIVQDLGRNVLGRTDIWTINRNITLDDRYLEDLNDKGMEALLKTIIHESIHRTESRYKSDRERNGHTGVYTEAQNRADLQKSDFRKEVMKENNVGWW